MRVHKLICAFFVLAFIVSCSDEMRPNETSAYGKIDRLTEAEAKVLFRMRNPDNRVSIDEAVEQANWVIDFLNGESSLKSGPNRRISSVSALVSDNKPVALKSSEFGDVEIPDTLAYVLNFEDSLGFAIISADTRIDEPVLGFTGSGSLIDSTDNPGIAIFLENLENYMLNSIVEAEQQKDSLIGGILEKLDIETSTKVTEEEREAAKKAAKEAAGIKTETIELILPLVPVEWNQDAPFNDNLAYRNCPETTNGRVWAGCVAVAVAQIMSRWKYPASIDGYSFNWDELNKNKRSYNFSDASLKKQVANLMQQIGKGVGMDYGCNGSGASTGDAINFLGKHGFSKGGLVSYNSANAIASMKRREPLIVRGCSIKTNYSFLGLTVYTSYSGCHAWVIDGYLKRRMTIGNTGFDFDYIHNNWGWNGKDNGYFQSGVFNSNQGPNIPSSGTKSGEAKNYQYDIEMASYIRR